MAVIQLFVLFGLCVCFHNNYDTVPYIYCNRWACKPTAFHPITEKHCVGKLISFYPNSTASFRYRLLIAGDINPNPGPSEDLRDSVTGTTDPTFSHKKLPITYSRDALIRLNGSHRMSSDTWLRLKELNLNAYRPTRRNGQHCHKRHLIPTVTSNVKHINDVQSTRYNLLTSVSK